MIPRPWMRIFFAASVSASAWIRPVRSPAQPIVQARAQAAVQASPVLTCRFYVHDDPGATQTLVYRYEDFFSPIFTVANRDLRWDSHGYRWMLAIGPDHGRHPQPGLRVELFQGRPPGGRIAVRGSRSRPILPPLTPADNSQWRFDQYGRTPGFSVVCDFRRERLPASVQGDMPTDPAGLPVDDFGGEGAGHPQPDAGQRSEPPRKLR